MKKKIILVMIVIISVILMGRIYISRNNETLNNELQNNNSQNNIKDNINLENEINTNTENLTSDLEKVNNTTNNSSNENNSVSNQKDATIIKQLSPSGFMGSSLYKVNLYSNGEVYVITYDGNGYEDTNIVSKDMIAKNANSIEKADEENEGGITVNGGEKINENFIWIFFSK